MYRDGKPWGAVAEYLDQVLSIVYPQYYPY
jgi:hypothetical protein